MVRKSMNGLIVIIRTVFGSVKMKKIIHQCVNDTVIKSTCTKQIMVNYRYQSENDCENTHNGSSAEWFVKAKI